MKQWMKALVGVACALSFVNANAQDLSTEEIDLMNMWDVMLKSEYEQAVESVLSAEERITLTKHILSKGKKSKKHAKRFVRGAKVINNTFVRWDVKDAFSSGANSVKIYDCTGGTFTAIIGAAYGKCTTVQIYRNGEASTWTTHQVGFKLALGAEAKMYFGTEVQKSDTNLIGIDAEADLNSSFTLIMEYDKDLLDGNPEATFFDDMGGFGLGFTPLSAKTTVGFPRGILSFKLSNEYMERVRGTY